MSTLDGCIAFIGVVIAMLCLVRIRRLTIEEENGTPGLVYLLGSLFGLALVVAPLVIHYIISTKGAS